MEKFVFSLMFILYMLGEVGCIILFSNLSTICNVKVGQDADIKWNFKIENAEQIEYIDVGYINKQRDQTYLASKMYNREIIYMDQYSEGRYKDEVTINIDDNSGVELTLKHVQSSTDDNVTYFAVFVSTKDGAESEVTRYTTVIVIEVPILIGKADSPQYVLENNGITLPCKAEGKPPPDIKWYKQGSPDDVIIADKETRSLKLNNLKRLQGSNYTCVASNIAGEDQYTVAVVVQYPPTINKTASSSRVGTYLNNPKHVYLECYANGEPPPTYKWNNPLQNEISGDRRYAVLQPQRSEIGIYVCQAFNTIFGQPFFDTLSVEVYEIREPDMVQINITLIQRRSAVVYIDVPTQPGGGVIRALRLSYSANGKTNMKVLTDHAGKQKVTKLTNLIPYTEYKLNVTVKNEYFESKGQNKLLMTKEDKPGPPSNVIVHAISPYVMRVSWEEPKEKNGVITKYILKFSEVADWHSNYTIDPSSTFQEIQHLEPYTMYNASVRASTNVGYGVWSESVTQRTQAEAPGLPSNISVALLTNEANTISVRWFPPASGVAPLTIYNINVTCISKEDREKLHNTYDGKVQDVTKASSYRTVSVSKLLPYSTCVVSIREGAGSAPRWGKYSPPKWILMPDSAPGKPKNLVWHASHDRIWFTWERPDKINGVLKKYEIKYINSSGTYSAELEKELDNKTFYYQLAYLNQMTEYTIKVLAHTEDYESDPVVRVVETSRMPTPALSVSRREEGNAGPVIGGVLTVLFILVLAAVILLYIVRKKKRIDRANSSSSDAGFFQKGENGHIHLVDGPMHSPVTKSVFMMSDYVKNAQCTFTPKNPIPITSLKDFVQKYHLNKAKGFIDEFRSIKCDRAGSLDVSSRAENKCKNRYANILAYDHSRVVLNTVEDLEGSDYVNANYIDGYNKKAKFIATQGPVVAAFNDFWRMIWEQDANKIIMVTNLVEKSRIKCQKYWPSESEKGVLYGNIKVQMIDELQLAEYVVRRFSITQVKDDVELSSRTVTQYQFLSWPDHGVPQYPTALLQFVKRVRSLDQGTTGPIVCHCSAGVGRTGTYITLDAMLDQLESEKAVDILGFVTHIRGQRQLMVQTEAQYIYIYDTLLEAVSCGNTEVNTADLFTRIKHLDSINPGTTRTYMQEEFERVTLNKEDDTNQYEAALLPCNVPKNRYPDVIPYELTRVKLWPYADIEGSDYINASFVDGYQQREAYILTQSPLKNTVEEFWRMLWEYEIFTIVMISSPLERSKHHCYPYWSLNNERTSFGILAVQMATEEEKVGFIRRDFRVTNSKNGESRNISHFMYYDWPTEGSPDTASVIEMIGQVQKTQQQTGNCAIVVHCSDGSGRSGSLAALMYCLERLKLEGLVDVFQTVRSMRTQRVGLVQSLEQYNFIYIAVSNFLDCFSNYANFK